MTDPALVARLRAAGCVFAEEEAAHLVEAAGADEVLLEDLVRRRVAGEPLETLVGWVDFCGVRVGLRPGVFVPRQRTALLVEAALARLPRGGGLRIPGRADGAGMVVVDLCCGAGALGLAFASRMPIAELHAADLDLVAVACARDNLADIASASVHQGDLFDALPRHLRGRVDVLLANTPYVPTEAIRLLPPEARDHEPRHTLDGGEDGLRLARRVGQHATEWLAPGGLVLVETSTDQAPLLARHFSDHGLEPEVVTDEATGGTAVVGRFQERRVGTS